MKINNQWHLKNKMPKNPNFDQRIAWHFEHSKNCSCRQMPSAIAEELEKRGLLSDAN